MHVVGSRSQAQTRLRIPLLPRLVAIALLLCLCAGQGIPELPKGVTRTNVVVLGATLVLAGGGTTCDAVPTGTADTLTFDMNDPTADWEIINGNPLPQPIFGTSYMAVGGAGPSAFISYAASDSDTVSGQFYAFDAAAKSWSKCAAELNTKRRAAAFVATRTHLFVFGGVDEEETSVTNYEYCTASCDCASWTLVEPPNVIRVKKQSGFRSNRLRTSPICPLDTDPLSRIGSLHY